MRFPKDFTWGVAASSYQIEGAAWRANGGYSVWDMLGRQQGRIADGHTGEVACDHYHRFREDVDLMAQIGVQAYRFSVSWPRVLPSGRGAVNREGLDFYNRLVDALLEKNVQPWLTLFHWDFPYDLYCQGGWLNRDSADWFAEYTALIVDTLSDRVAHWCTLNEPQIYIGMGHYQGTHAPGLQMGLAEALRAGHHTLLGHGKAVQAIRARAKTQPFVCASQVGKPSMPMGDSDADIEAARAHMFSIRERNFFNNTWFADPMFLGGYPEDGLELFAPYLPEFESRDFDSICQPLDFYGTNIYWGVYGHADEHGDFQEIERHDLVRTDLDWPVTPEALYWGPRFFYERYAKPVVVTENGLAHADRVQDGAVHDQGRIEFLYRYLEQYGRAIADGIECPAYLHWSVLDNLEWAEGYSKRFGLIRVDYETQERTLKDSAYWYRDLIRCGELPPVGHARQRTLAAG